VQLLRAFVAKQFVRPTRIPLDRSCGFDHQAASSLWVATMAGQSGSAAVLLSVLLPWTRTPTLIF
jgi:hypothetical protein